MSNFSKMLAALVYVGHSEAVVQTAQRVEIKQGRSGNYRVFIAAAPGLPSDAADTLSQALGDKGITVNLFLKAGHLITVTLVDDDEDKGQ